jgi:putative aldouronate transport system permease protein
VAVNEMRKGARGTGRDAGGRRRRGRSRDLLRNPLYADAVIWCILLITAIASILPVLVVLVRSVSPTHVINQYPVLLWPKEWTLEGYRYLFKTSTLLRSFGVSVFVTCVGTFLNLAVTLPAAYGLSKTRIPGNKLLMGIMVFTMLFSAGLIPKYILVTKLGLIDSLWSLILPLLASPFNIILMRNYVWNVPGELEDSAHIDGAGDFTVLFKLIIPLSKPAIATVGLFYAVGHWNDFFHALFYINDNTKWPMQLLLRSIVINNNFQNMGTVNEAQLSFVNPENIKAATIVFATVPILCVYPFVQKYFVKGIMIGAVKG